MRCDSSAPMPAIGSSSSSRRGIAGQRHGDLELALLAVAEGGGERVGARARARPRRGPAAPAARRLSSRRASARKRKEWPAWAWTASATLSRAVNSRSTEVIWKERASPSRTRACVGRRVTSRPAKWMVPAVGPEVAGELAHQGGLARAVGADQGMDLARPDVDRDRIGGDQAAEALDQAVGARAAAQPWRRPEQRIDAALGVERDQHQHRAEHDLPVFAPALAAEIEQRLQRFLQHEEGDGAVERAEQRAHAAQHDDDDEVARLHPRHHGGRDIGALVGEQDARQAAEGAGQDEGGQPVAEHREAERRHAQVVRLGAADHQAEARIGEAAAEPQGAAAAARSTASRTTPCRAGRSGRGSGCG